MFSPVLFSIGIVAAPDPDASLARLREALALVTTDINSGYVIDSEVVAFANRHPDLSKDVLVEVQALNEEARARGMAIVEAKVAETIGTEFNWDDVTEIALAYHLELKNSKEESSEVARV